MPHTDATAVALARDGDSEAFRALVDRHSRAVYRLAHRMTGNPQDAEDVVQETFLKAYRQLGRFESRANFSTWLHRIAVNCSIDLIRGRKHQEAGHDASDLEALDSADDQRVDPSPERLMLSTEVQEKVGRAMEGLTHMERAAFVLRHFEGQSIEEISRALGLKANAAKHSIFRAVRKMRLALEPFVEELDIMHLNDDDLVLHYYGEMPSAEEARAARASRGVRRVPAELHEAAAGDGVRRQRARGRAAPGFERIAWARLEPALAASRRGALARGSCSRRRGLALAAGVAAPDRRVVHGRPADAGDRRPAAPARRRRRSKCASGSCSWISASTSIDRRWCWWSS